MTCGKPSRSWPSSVRVSSTPTCPAATPGSPKAPESGPFSPDSLLTREQTSRSSAARALPAPKHTGWSLPGSALAWLLLLLGPALGGCCPATSPSVRPLLPVEVEPPAEEQAELGKREALWAFLDAAGLEVVDPEAAGVVTVVIPFRDYELLLGVLDGWRAAARAYRKAALFQEPAPPTPR